MQFCKSYFDIFCCDMYRNQKNLKGKSRRKDVSTADLLTFPYCCIGKIRINQINQIGTGFLISESLILTSAHLFESLPRDKMNPEEPISLSFQIYNNIDGIPTMQDYQIKDYRICPIYKQIEQKQLLPAGQQYNDSKTEKQRIRWLEKMKQIDKKTAKYDYALAKLQSKIYRHSYFQLYQNLESLTQVTLCGFVDNVHLEYQSDKLKQIKNGVILYDIDTINGQSGSPVFDQKNNFRLIGLHKGYSTDEKLNIGVLITSEIVSALYNWAVEMGVLFRVINPTEKQIPEKIKIKAKSAINNYDYSKQKVIELLQKLRQLTLSNQNLILMNQNLKIKLNESQIQSQTKSQLINNLQLKNKELEMIISNMVIAAQIPPKKFVSLQSLAYERIFDIKIQSTFQNQNDNIFPVNQSLHDPLPKNRIKQDKTIKIIQQGYSSIINKLIKIPEKWKITSLILKNTVLIEQQRVNMFLQRSKNS